LIRDKIVKLHFDERLSATTLAERFGFRTDVVHAILGRHRRKLGLTVVPVPEGPPDPVPFVTVEVLSHTRGRRFGPCRACREPSWFAVTFAGEPPIVLCRTHGYDFKVQVDRAIDQADQRRNGFNPVVSRATTKRIGAQPVLLVRPSGP
jgi:hypothetical protein